MAFSFLSMLLANLGRTVGGRVDLSGVAPDAHPRRTSRVGADRNLAGLRVRLLVEEDGRRVLRALRPGCPDGVLDTDNETDLLGWRCSSAMPSFILSHWVRETGLYSLAKGIRRITSASARIVGLEDRGVLKQCFRADVNVFDPSSVAELQPKVVHDFPGGAPRYIQKSRGYKATIVNGEINVEDGEHTGARAGTVIRHGV